MSKNALLTLLAVIVILAGVSIYSMNQSPSDSSYAPSATTTPTQSAVPTQTVSLTPGQTSVTTAIKTFTVNGTNFSFSPSKLTVNKGDKVRIIFNNNGGVHDWKIDAFNAATKKINSGETDTIEFIADKAGSFEYYCSIGQHRQMGMKGTLVVK